MEDLIVSDIKIDSKKNYLEEAINDVIEFVESRKNNVFYYRQIEILLEDKYFHWITNKAIHTLVESNYLKSEVRNIKNSSPINLLYKKENRYYKREANKIISLVEKYSDPKISYAIGMHAEYLVLDGLANINILTQGRNTNKYNNKKWEKSDHDLDLIFEINNISYGVEIKNSLSYIDKKEMEIKIEICKHLGIIPMFIVRMMPKNYINSVNLKGGFVLILKYQLYPIYLSDLVEEIKLNIGLPLAYPKKLEAGTILRFLNWHKEHVNL